MIGSERMVTVFLGLSPDGAELLLRPLLMIGSSFFFFLFREERRLLELDLFGPVLLLWTIGVLASGR